MNKSSLIIIAALQSALLLAHDHIEIGLDPSDASRLKVISGQPVELVTYFPPGEAPSAVLTSFPGGTFATELTFSAFDTTSIPPEGALVKMEVLSVAGPQGGSFSFWETGASSATWTRPSGWQAGATDRPIIYVSEDESGYGHIHGRVFSATAAGNYQVTFHAVDTLGRFTSTDPFVVTFSVIEPPRLGISATASNATVTFTGRDGLVYDLQSSTTLQANDWTTIDTLDGSGGPLSFSEPLGGRPRVFYRLVEYQ